MTVIPLRAASFFHEPAFADQEINLQLRFNLRSIWRTFVLAGDNDFLSIIGSEPTLSLIAETETDPLFHEAVVWYVNPLNVNLVKLRTWDVS